ncbi:hypothetical protein [Microbacterium sp. ProA8]|uniref:hypothetical protein n=1 Tax=Microbacterium chionoecetis TaxID=3153754 RepID=UPI003263F8A5
MIAGALGMTVALVATIVVWSFVLGTWVPHRLAVAGATAGTLLSLTAPRPLAALLDAPLAVMHGGVVLLLFVSGLALLIARRRRVGWSRDIARTWVSASAGGILWVAVVAISQILPGAARIGWVLNGDGLLQLEAVGRSLAQPEPGLARIPYAILTLTASPFGAIELSGETIGSEVYALVLAWALQLAMWCIIAGGVMSGLVPSTSRTTTVVVAAAGSMLPLTALMGGLAMEWGYVNANVAIPVALLTWLALSESRRRPFATIVVLAVVMSVLWLSWEPLAALPGVAALTIAWRVRREVRHLRGFRLVVVCAAVSQFLLIFGSNYLNRTSSAGNALTIEGHGLPSMWLGLVLASVTAVAGAIFGRRLLPSWVLPSSVSVVAGAAVAMSVVLVFTVGDADALSGYYPTKLMYFLCAVMFTIAAAVVVGLLSRVRVRSVATIGSAVAVTTALVIAAAIAPTAPGLDDSTWRRQPPVAVLAGTQWAEGEKSVDLFLKLAQPDHLGFLWRSGNPDEAIVDYRVIVTNGGNAYGDIPLRMVAFPGYQGRRASVDYPGVEPVQVCTVLARMPGVTIYTRAPDAVRKELAQACDISHDDITVRSVDEL